MLRRRAPIAMPSARWVPRSFGPRCDIASVIRSRTDGAATGRGVPRTWTIPQIPHIYTRRYAALLVSATAFWPDPTIPLGRASGGEREAERACVTGSDGAAPGDDEVRERAEGDPAALERCGRPAPVLARVEQAACRERGEQRGPRGRRAAFVDGHGFRLVADRVPGVPDTAAEVDVLAVHEEALVQ